MFLHNTSSSLSALFPASGISALSETSELNVIPAPNSSNFSVPFAFPLQGSKTYFPVSEKSYHRLPGSTIYGPAFSASEESTILEGPAKLELSTLGSCSPSSTLVSVDAVRSTSIGDSCSTVCLEDGPAHPVFSCLRTTRKRGIEMQGAHELIQQPEGQDSAQLEAILSNKVSSDKKIRTTDMHPVNKTNKCILSSCQWSFQGPNIDSPLPQVGSSCSNKVLSEQTQETGSLTGSLSQDLDFILADVKGMINKDSNQEVDTANLNRRGSDNSGSDLDDLLDILLNQTEAQLSPSPTHELGKSVISKNCSSSLDFKPVAREEIIPSLSKLIFQASIPTSAVAYTQLNKSQNKVGEDSFFGYSKISEQRQRWDWQIAGTGSQLVGSYREQSRKTTLNPTSSDALSDSKQLGFPIALVGPTLLDIESALALMNRTTGIMGSPRISSSSSVSSSFGEGYDEETSGQKVVGEATNSNHKLDYVLSTDRVDENMQKLDFWSGIQKRNAAQPRHTLKIRSNVDNIDDGYRWRKYGQKAIKNSPYPRSYYRCTSSRCSVKKQVERSTQDPSLFLVSYEGIHLHHRPNPLCSLHTHTVEAGEVSALSGQTHNTSTSKTSGFHPNVTGTRSSASRDLLLDNMTLRCSNNPISIAECVLTDCKLFPSNTEHNNSQISHGLLEDLVPAQLLHALQGSK
eukprot:c20340_g1_i2 orf=765-2822(+)